MRIIKIEWGHLSLTILLISSESEVPINNPPHKGPANRTPAESED